jgi:hypothetical protein
VAEYMLMFKALLDQHPEVDQERLVRQIEAFSA